MTVSLTVSLVTSIVALTVTSTAMWTLTWTLLCLCVCEFVDVSVPPFFTHETQDARNPSQGSWVVGTAWLRCGCHVVVCMLRVV